MIEAAQILNIEVPDLYVRQNHVPNAYTLAYEWKKAVRRVHTILVELLTRKELQVKLCVSWQRSIHNIVQLLQRCIFLFFFFLRMKGAFLLIL
jgi:hypothetical protein